MDALKEWNLPQPQSKVTIVLLQELVERKIVEKQYKAKSQSYGYILAFLLVSMGCFFWYELENSTSFFVNELTFNTIPMLLILVISSVVTYFQLRKFSKKTKKAEDEYESLRLEILDRSDELFEGQKQWESRHVVFKYLKEEYDINLYYK
ncbi:DUF2663 family protein [Guptibacillus hwajinpoensis]|uniref:DUF2663 family protein n=1 Tax=Guptibacillus hwajinpoensis TaxID=208199 RepID=UPI001CD74875|nr:YpbF family protein [Pseudalkalibacillus hwajinpoensis]